jgi:hypothetical protein
VSLTDGGQRVLELGASEADVSSALINSRTVCSSRSIVLVAGLLAACSSHANSRTDGGPPAGDAPQSSALDAATDAPPPPPPAPAHVAALWAGHAHFVTDQNPAPVPGAAGHREAFAIERPDLGAAVIFLYHRCFNPGANGVTIDICLDVSHDGGASFAEPHGIVIHKAHAFAVAPSVARIAGIWTMVWEEGGTADGTYFATSADGIAWTNRGSLFGGTTYRATPGLYQFQGVVYVFSAQRIPATNSLGISFDSGPSLGGLVPYGGGFVLRGATGWNASSVSMPRIVYQDGQHWMTFEGASENLDCGATTAQQNVYGWGVARSTTLTSWEQWSGNPVAQSNDLESCGMDMPQPLLLASGELFVYHPSDDVLTVHRERLTAGSACTPAQALAGWREKDFICMPSCGGAGGTACFQTKSCATGTAVVGQPGFPGTSFDCASCCQ